MVLPMSRTASFIVAIATACLATQADAQGRYNRGQSRNEIARAQGIPPGQMPPANLCRVWYENRAPGRQPGPTNCRTAESVASRDRNARVIYGEGSYDARSGYGTYDDRYRHTPTTIAASNAGARCGIPATATRASTIASSIRPRSSKATAMASTKAAKTPTTAIGSIRIGTAGTAPRTAATTTTMGAGPSTAPGTAKGSSRATPRATASTPDADLANREAASAPPPVFSAPESPDPLKTPTAAVSARPSAAVYTPQF